MANNTAIAAEQKYAFGKLVANKYLLGVADAAGTKSVHNYDLSKSVTNVAAPIVPNEDQMDRGVEELVLPKRFNGQQKSSETSRYMSNATSSPMTRVKGTARIPNGTLNGTQGSNARKMAILEAQTTLMSKIVEDTRETLSEVFAKEMKDKIYAQYDKTAAAHREEVKSELVKQLTPGIKASLKARYTARAMDEVRKEVRSEFELELIKKFNPEVKTLLRAKLVDTVKEELRQELKAKIYLDLENHDRDDDGNRRYRQRDYLSHHRHSRSRSPKRVDRDEQAAYHPSRISYDEDTWFPTQQDDEIETIYKVQENSLPSLAFRGVKRSRIEQEYDEDDYLGCSSKRACISGFGGNQDDADEEEYSGEENEEESVENSEEESGEESVEGDEKESWNEMGQTGEWGIKTHGFAKEDSIDSVDSGFESEKTWPRIANQISESFSDWEDSESENYVQAGNFLSGMLRPHPDSAEEDVWLRLSVIEEEFPDYESEEGEYAWQDGRP